MRVRLIFPEVEPKPEGKQDLWQVFQKHKQARPPGKGESATAEYRLRLLIAALSTLAANPFQLRF